MTRVQVTIDGIEAEAELFEQIAPEAVDALKAMLPIDASAVPVRWSGSCATVHLASALARPDELEVPVTSIYPGALVLRLDGESTRLLIGFGVAEFRWQLGVDYNCLVGKIANNRAAFLRALSTTPDRGRVPFTAAALSGTSNASPGRGM